VAEQQKKYRLSTVLKSLAEEKRTGTLICIGDDNIQGRILLREGRPISARCRNLQGKEALIRINQHRLVSLKFHKNQNFVTLEDETDMTETSATADSHSEQVSPVEYQSLVDISSLAQLEDDKTLQTPLTAELQTMIAEELTEYLGPLADMFVADLQPGISLIDALDSLSRDIGDVDASIEFVNKVKERI
jgi:hypothetical protein